MSEGQQAPPGYVPYGTPQYLPGYGPPAPDHPQATLILIFGILGVVGITVLGPVAWILGNNALKEIDASNGMIGGRGNVNAGRICGIIATVILGISLVAVFVMLMVFVFVVPTQI